MDSTFSRIDNLLNDVDRFLGENRLSSEEGGYNSSDEEKKSTISRPRFSSPIQQTRNDINELLRRANIEPTSTSYLPKNFKYSQENDQSQENSFNDSFHLKDIPSSPGSPSYDFLQSRNAAKSNRMPSPYLSSPETNINQQDTKTNLQIPTSYDLPQNTQIPNQTYQQGVPKRQIPSTSSNYVSQSAEQIEIEMLTIENAKLIEELKQYQARLQNVVQKNSQMLKQIEKNEMDLYSLKSKH